MTTVRELLTDGFTEMGLVVSDRALEQCEMYLSLLLEKNQVMNLTAITDPEQAVRLHFLDAAAILAYGGSSPGWLREKRVIDIGTGAGFPGLVLKILEPSITLVLLDSMKKRLDWLGELCDALSMDSVERLHGRAEEQALLDGFRDTFDVAVSRAVAALPQLTELCLPFVKPGGDFIAMKSMDSDKEIAAAQHTVKRLGGAPFQSRAYRIPGTPIVRRLVCAKKRTATPAGYPRTWGRIKKTPL